MSELFSPSRLKTVAVTIAVLAVAMRVPATRDIIVPPAGSSWWPF
jgi:hypothetical protein